MILFIFIVLLFDLFLNMPALFGTQVTFMNIDNSRDNVQNRAVRIIYGFYTYDFVLAMAGLQTLNSRRYDICRKFIW